MRPSPQDWAREAPDEASQCVQKPGEFMGMGHFPIILVKCSMTYLFKKKKKANFVYLPLLFS